MKNCRHTIQLRCNAAPGTLQDLASQCPYQRFNRAPPNVRPGWTGIDGIQRCLLCFVHGKKSYVVLFLTANRMIAYSAINKSTEVIIGI